MANDGQIVFEVSLDDKNVRSGISNITKTIQQETKEWDGDAKKSSDNISGSFANMAKKIAAAISAAKIGQMLLNIGKDAIEAASNLEEVQNVVDVTFGDTGALKIEKWAKKAGTQFGLTETQAKQFTSTLGAMMKSAGLTGDEIVNMSTDMAGLAADMASFYNLDFDTAFQKIRSGISGETEPLKQLGINMSVANLNAFALAQGLGKTFEQMDQGEQTVLRYQYLMQATADAQGDFARTSDGYANSLRLMETNIESLKAKLGEVLLPAVNSVVSALNSMLSSLAPTEERTVLDDFRDIDLQTEKKIAQIKSTSGKATALVKVLEDIGQKITDNKTNAGTMMDDVPDGSELDDLVTALENVGTEAGNDKTSIGEIANSAPNGNTLTDLTAKLIEIGSKADSDQKKIENIESKAPDGSKIGTLADGLVKIGEEAGTAKTAVGEILDDTPKAGQKFSSIEQKLRVINSVAGRGKTSIGEITDEAPDGSKLEGVEKAVEGVESAANDAATAVESISNPTAEAATNSDLWLETCRQLVETLPGLSSIIDTQTGEIKGGTQAVRDYIDAWEESQKLAALNTAHTQKQAALNSKFSELPGLELDKLVADYRLSKAETQLNNMLKKYGIDETANTINKFKPNSAYATETLGLSLDEATDLSGEIEYYKALQANARDATDAYNKQISAYNEAVAAYEEEGKAITDTYGEAQGALDGWTDAQKAAATSAVESFGEALTAVEEYYNKVKEATTAQVNSTLSGFDYVKSAAEQYEEAMDSARDYKQELADLKAFFDDGIELKVDTTGANKSLTDMVAGMQSQINFINEYEKNLTKAREKGFSESMLAMLSDGSTESAAYLNAIASAADDIDTETVAEINALWDTLTDKKETFATTLTEQKLTIDTVYDSLVEKAQAAAKELDISETASTNTGKSIDAVANAIKDNVPDVAAQVDDVLAQLNRINAWQARINFNTQTSSNAGTNAVPSKKAANGAIAVPLDIGMDFVPFDGFLAQLHEGEAVLTAEENRIWQQFKTNQRGVDYDALGGVMRDNVKAGGDVYLDGRVVGQVISQVQGNQYRTLQRSGWQK